MKKISIFSISIILLVILIYVFARPKPDIISVNLVSETNEITYSDSESVQIFEDAIRTVKKVRGSVDVGPPNYQMTVTYADSKVVEYSLYMDFKTKNGFLIKQSNSEKMLDLKDQNSEELADLLSKGNKE
ncbi:hypothetical protein P40081_25980 [Paenibacillus sp. FSL P4-0081]|jgi:hypothetical protein|uniref:hypothetical protein n=1 Tax=Paenibacillus sp. FSL P4-0081 TaxID=1536769 RepID=UPI0004F7829C|nr:hypothetical protein [Paenibacillus sp. FSL P4-0081]AIQ31228.1 hypothetical protein P40081_25980 [Paenibacillus sp. FSL P4-0081]